jgi:DNA-directed RNA polymerase subunit RPC12/RpoP
MPRLKCSKCGNVFEMSFMSGVAAGLVHLGPYKLLKCPACGKRSFFNLYSSVQESVTWPEQEKLQQTEAQMTEQEIEKKKIEESKYERP